MAVTEESSSTRASFQRSISTAAASAITTTANNRWQHLLLRYRVLEFTCSVVMMAVGAIFAFMEVHERDFPHVEMRLNATVSIWGLDPTINQKKLAEQVPMMTLVIACGILPIMFNLFLNYVLPKFKRVRIIPHDTRDFLLTLLQSISMAFVLTQFMKNMTGRFRPSFHEMCGWQFDVVWDGVTNLCTNDVGEKEGRKSFPSGHSSFAWSTMLPLTLYLLGRSRLNCENRSESLMRGGRKTLKLFLCFLPCLVATWVAITRSVDNWHHYTDIVTGSIVGAVAASLAYSYNYGSVFSWESAGVPYQEYHNRRKRKMRDMVDTNPIATTMGEPKSLYRPSSIDTTKRSIDHQHYTINMSTNTSQPIGTFV